MKPRFENDEQRAPLASEQIVAFVFAMFVLIATLVVVVVSVWSMFTKETGL